MVSVVVPYQDWPDRTKCSECGCEITALTDYDRIFDPKLPKRAGGSYWHIRKEDEPVAIKNEACEDGTDVCRCHETARIWLRFPEH